MKKKLPPFFAQVPEKSEYNPIKRALDLSADNAQVSAALKLFSSMPPSTRVFANPVLHRRNIPCGQTSLELDIRSFTLRGLLFEEEIVMGKADTWTVVFTGLFGRRPQEREKQSLSDFIAASFRQSLEPSLTTAAEFLKRFPATPPEIVAQHWATFRKVLQAIGPVNTSRKPADLLAEMIGIHMNNVAVSACSSYMRHLLRGRKSLSTGQLVRSVTRFIEQAGTEDPFRLVFCLLLRRPATSDDLRILGQMGTIQIHHGSAGSNMVARYLASLHTRSVSDLFTAAQMTLDSGRHFGAISDMSDFVRLLEKLPQGRRDGAIRERIIHGNLPTFGHPEIAAAGRQDRLEMDPRPALYLSPLFEAIDQGTIQLDSRTRKRTEILERIYQLALVEGVLKAGDSARLRLTPNTDFGAWLVQEVLGIEEPDRTLLSYAYRGFGWMMDVREQLQQPIVRPVIPPDPEIVPSAVTEDRIPETILLVHERLAKGQAFRKMTPTAR